jgi:tetratricopeptide (TPR) repeat protein
MKTKGCVLLVLFMSLAVSVCRACLWDATTLTEEKQRHPELAKVVLGELPPAEDPKLMRERIEKLMAERRENEVMWWNNLAVAYIKLGELKEAVALLESVTNRFANDYGIHANLGTAYHLMGRYREAEKEIARDLEINPDAHFGLERYHLALLKYLNKDKEYQKQHVYVDIWTSPFLKDDNIRHMFNGMRQAVGEAVQKELENGKKDPEGGFQGTFIEDPKFEQGVVYMASLNPKEPACFVMLGVMCLTEKLDFHLGAAAFQKAIDLGSPQKEVLQHRLLEIQEFIKRSEGEERQRRISSISWNLFCSVFFVGLPAIGAGCVVFKKIRRQGR